MESEQTGQASSVSEKAFEAISEKALYLGWPLTSGYTTDLTKHDRKALENFEGDFLWSVYPWGTHLLLPREEGDKSVNTGSAWESIYKGLLFSDALVYLVRWNAFEEKYRVERIPKLEGLRNVLRRLGW